MKKIALAAVALTFAAAPAMANHDMWKEKDANGDGVITKAEASSYHEKKFDMMDTNKDGKLTKAEAEAHWKSKDGKKDWNNDDGDNGRSGSSTRGAADSNGNSSGTNRNSGTMNGNDMR